MEKEEASAASASEDVDTSRTKSASSSFVRFDTRRFDQDEEQPSASLQRAPLQRRSLDLLGMTQVFGGFSTRRFDQDEVQRASSGFHQDLLGISQVRSTKSFTKLGPLFLVLGTLSIPYMSTPVVMFDLVPRGKSLLPLALSALAVVPATFFLVWCSYIMKKSFGFGSDAKDGENKRGALAKTFGCHSPSVSGVSIFLAMVFRQARYFQAFYTVEAYRGIYQLMLDHAASFCIFTGVISALDGAHGVLLDHARKIDTIAAENSRSNKGRSIMKKFSSFDNLESDRGFAIPGGHRSAARVLAEIVGIYCNIGKVLAATVLLLFFLDIDLYSSFVALGLTVVFTGIISALHINEAFKNILSLVISNAVHVGEIISVGRTGFAPADNPKDGLTGFVEGFTWTHVIIRDFKRKQTFIRHDEFGTLTMHNWSRRPNKHAHFVIPIVPELSGGADRLAKLAEYARKWIKAHPGIDQEGYQKAVIKIKERGLVLEVIFFPALGQKARQIKSEFIVFVLNAARRYNLCLMPAEVELRSSMPWSDGQEQNNAFEEVDLDDLFPSQQLTERAGFKPKML